MAYQILTHKLPTATLGTNRVITAHQFGLIDQNKKKIYLQAGLHADEWPGFLVLNELVKLLKQADEQQLIQGEIIVVPVANPIGLAQNFHGYIPGRFAFSDGGGNFNRNWPQLGEKIESIIKSEITADLPANVTLVKDALRTEVATLPENTELQGLKKTLLLMSIDADEVIDLHCSGEACMHAYVAQEFEQYFQPLLSRLNTQVALSELDTGAASFDESNVSVWRHLRQHYSHMIPWGARSLTLELRGENDISKEQAKLDANAIFDYLCEREIICQPTRVNVLNKVECFPLDAMDLVKAPSAGIVCYFKEIGESVEEGELIGEIVDPSGDLSNNTYPLISKANGILFARLQRRLVVYGESIAKIAGKEHLAHREIGHLFDD
ncbi:succinylglutamate desuccinylase [Marinomonas agarivorans]|nr:succinylglutamate desuccinylase [Marinomonas agarivorans]